MASPSRPTRAEIRRHKQTLEGLTRICGSGPKADLVDDPYFYRAKRFLRRQFRSARMIEIAGRRLRVWGRDGNIIFQVP